MKKRKKGRVFSRKKGPRKGLFISLVRALAEKEKIQTTEAKAKELSPLFERLITKAKQDTLHSRRQLLRYIPPALVQKMISKIAPRYRERQGGYTRIVKTGQRNSDGARMAVIELVK